MINDINRKNIILEKIIHYCNYQERSVFEVTNKLKRIGANSSNFDYFLSELFTQGLLDNQRYADSFARGKFRNNQWGKEKIKHWLRRNRIHEEHIEQALNSLDTKEYLEVLRNIAKKRVESMNEPDINLLKLKVQSYLVQKGFERKLSMDVIKEILNC